MLVVPIVCFSLTSGVANLNELNTLGKIGIKSITLYILTTFFAISGSLIFANLLIPGKGFNLKIENNDLFPEDYYKNEVYKILKNNDYIFINKIGVTNFFMFKKFANQISDFIKI